MNTTILPRPRSQRSTSKAVLAPPNTSSMLSLQGRPLVAGLSLYHLSLAQRPLHRQRRHRQPRWRSEGGGDRGDHHHDDHHYDAHFHDDYHDDHDDTQVATIYIFIIISLIFFFPENFTMISRTIPSSVTMFSVISDSTLPLLVKPF